MNSLDHSPTSFHEISDLLEHHNVVEILVKKLTRNHNDKNQVRAGSDFALFHSRFELEYLERAFSTSVTKRHSDPSKRIPEARFKRFHWLDKDGELERAKSVKAIIYAQYPEVRLSGFLTDRNRIPSTMAIEFTKANPDTTRYLVLARTLDGTCIGVMIHNPGPSFATEVKRLPRTEESRTWHTQVLLAAKASATATLKQKLRSQINTWHAGSRLKPNNEVVPFAGTQVCGYTLEKVLELPTNSDKNGDFQGIELKACTQKKVTLFTPEPDQGLYSQDFGKCMVDYGKESPPNSGTYRLTGTHRAGIRCAQTKLTLKVEGYKKGTNINKEFSRIRVGLYDDDDTLVAGWSLERLLNNWSQKHNEAVYVFAEKRPCENPELIQNGYKFEVKFKPELLWCNRTSPENLLDAILDGTVFLDPAPKYVENDPSKSKRRSQWRVNNIYDAVEKIYDSAEIIEIA